jgi:hypothetical protein
MVTNRDGSRTLIIPVNIAVGHGTPQEQTATAAAIAARANSLVMDDSTMRIQVTVTNRPIEGVLNQLDYSRGNNFGMCPGVGECTNRLGGDRIHINSDNADAISAAAHDILHLAGVKDAYTEGPRDAAGNRTSTINPGHTDQEIMARRSGTHLTRSQFDEAGRNSTTRQRCVSEPGTLIRRCTP